MKYLLMTSGSDMPWCGYALVDIDDSLAELIGHRRRLLDEAKKTDTKHLGEGSSPLFKMCFWSGLVDWYNEDDAALDLEKLLTKEQQEEFEHERKIVVPDDFEFSIDPSRSECDQMIIWENEVSWMCYPKHTDERVETEQILYSEIL